MSTKKDPRFKKLTEAQIESYLNEMAEKNWQIYLLTKNFKKAYGVFTLEVIFNEKDFYGLLRQNGLSVKQVQDSIPYDLHFILGEQTTPKTFVCEVS